ncbi:MAG TPA: tetratricopeptide repeat protein [Lentimicrobium sp.]|nr:tetratricopeptide repeat protein [Lentimicrobium sp.]
MRKSLLLYILCVITLKGACSTFTLTPLYQKAYIEILRLRFEAANNIISKEKIENPGNVAFIYLEAYQDFLKSIISEDPNEYDKIQDRKSERIKILNNVSEDSPWKIYAQAQLFLQEGIASVKSGEYVQAALDIKKAYTLFEENLRKFPQFKPNKAGIGLLYVLVGSIPDSYKWVPGIFGMQGNVKKGIGLLHETILYNPPDNKWPFLFNESLFITTFITFNLAGTDENINLLNSVLKDKRLQSELQINPLLIYAVSSFYSSQGENDKALQLLKKRPADISYYNFRYLDYLTGIACLNKLDPQSRIYLFKYITHFKGRNFIKSAYQRLAWSYLIEKDTLNYNKYISRVLLFGVSDMENDKDALSEAQSGSLPKVELLKARLLFDGGYYSSSFQVITAINYEKLTTDQKIEFNYRTARIKHKEGNLAKAKESYYKTFKTGRNSDNYYAANSMLNLGIIFEKEGKSEQALYCYRECLNLKFSGYQASIHQKAKAGLSRLSKK